MPNYEFSLVNYDVQTPETLLDVFHSLKTMSSTIDDIFGKIESKAKGERAKLDQINRRISRCQEKLRKIKGTKSAITILATSSFPSSSIRSPLSLLFTPENTEVIALYFIFDVFVYKKIYS